MVFASLMYSSDRNMEVYGVLSLSMEVYKIVVSACSVWVRRDNLFRTEKRPVQ